MAEMNQDMYGATGKLGNRTYYQRRGKTIARIITTPKNPKTDGQTLQRILQKAVNKTYSKLKTICNHTFEGYEDGFDCMNRFKTINLRYLREHAMTLLETGQGLEQFYQFAPLDSERWSPFAAIISQGYLPEITVGINAARGNVAYVNSSGRTYADFVKAWGLQRKDQLTFVTVQKYNGRYEVNIAHLVLDPRKADGSGAPMSTEIVNSDGEFPCYNKDNQLDFLTFEFDTDHFNFVLGRGGDVVAAAIIVSDKKEKEEWFYSNAQLVLNLAGIGPDLCSLAKAIRCSYAKANIDMEP